MIIRLLLAIGFCIVIFWYFKKTRALPKAQKKKAIIQLVLYTSIALILLAVVTGRIHWIGAVLAAILGFAKIGLTQILRMLPFLNVLRRNSPFGNPVFNTPHLIVQIDLKTGKVSGKIINGPLAGKALEELDQNDLKTIEDFYRTHDKRSFFLVKIFQQKNPNFSETDKQDFSSLSNPSVEEARLILGLSEGFSRAQVVKAHKSLIQKFHPDRGGNDYLAARINLAKDILIKYLEKK